MEKEEHTLMELLSKFDNGYERYQKSAMFHQVIDSLISGVSTYQIIDQLITINDDTTSRFQQYIQRAPLFLSPDEIFSLHQKK